MEQFSPIRPPPSYRLKIRSIGPLSLSLTNWQSNSPSVPSKVSVETKVLARSLRQASFPSYIAFLCSALQPYSNLSSFRHPSLALTSASQLSVLDVQD
ncbi:hypothetical protein TcWFU_000393 [Taenia crassiceps]|uniref:Uncharacterized protein n=1 Tax=Taenia crassiceps TaxID=6207 RepID=A0ABR4QJ79_9CEST